MFGKATYAIDEILENFDDRQWWRQRFFARVLGPITKSLAPDGIDVMAEDWDNLVVLDACRADTFENVIGTSQFDSYQRVTSRASATPEWIRTNFEDRSFGDAVYVSGNPWVSQIAPDAFHDIKNIWLEDYDFSGDAFAEADTLADLGIPFEETVSAQRVNQAAIGARAEYDDKRLLIHYIQPHAPYIGNPDGSMKDDVPTCHPGNYFQFEGIDREIILGLYRENLKYVWHHASKLVNELDGRTVITSDHGEMFGERLFPLLPFHGYDHPIGLHTAELLTVPWAVVDGTRRSIRDEGVQTVTVDETVADEHLRHLGYKT